MLPDPLQDSSTMSAACTAPHAAQPDLPCSSGVAISSGSIWWVSQVELAFGPSLLLLWGNNIRNCVENKARFKWQLITSVINNRKMSLLMSSLHEGI